MAGYSATPLAKKLGIKAGTVLFTDGAPANYRKLLAPLPDGVKFATRMSADAEIAHLFVTRRAELARQLKAMLDRMPQGRCDLDLLAEEIRFTRALIPPRQSGSRARWRDSRCRGETARRATGLR